MTAIKGPGRLGANPELRFVGNGDDKKPVCELRVRFINGKVDKATGEWTDTGFWATVNVWGWCAEPAAKMFSKGDRIYIDGTMVMNTWPDKENEGEVISGFKVDTIFVAPYLPDLELLRYKPRTTQNNAAEQFDQDENVPDGAEA